MAAIIQNKSIDYTCDGIEFVKRYLNAFGNVVYAEMKGDLKKAEYELTLKNDKDEEMVITRALSAGYAGEGPSGTYEVLKKCGFNISNTFIQENSNFKLTK